MSKAIEFGMAIWTLLIATGLLPFAIKWAIANTKNKNIKLFEEWALQAVQYAEANSNTSDAKKQEAIAFVANRLKANNLVGKFSDEQVDAVIEKAVAELHDWHPEIKQVEVK